MDSRYDLSEWAERTNLGRRILNIGYRLVSSDLKGWKLIKTVPMETNRSEGELAYVWVGNDDPDRSMIRVATAEFPDWGAAHERLLEDLRASMRSDIPPGTGELAALGDVNYVARDPETDVPASISFTRGNVMVTVRSVGDRTVAVGDVAVRIDRSLSRRPRRRQETRGQGKTVSITIGVRRAQDSHVLFKSLDLAAPRGSWLQIIAPEGELRRENEAVIYTADSPGEMTIETFLRR